MEQLDFNLLFRWFVGLGMDDPVWDATVFCKNRDRLLEAEVSADGNLGYTHGTFEIRSPGPDGEEEPASHMAARREVNTLLAAIGVPVALPAA